MIFDCPSLSVFICVYLRSIILDITVRLLIFFGVAELGYDIYLLAIAKN
ncbi:MAG: hypothetical protein HEQ27_23675 [Dolichospermum sp. JUN01]|nr:hypothetical protein [Dolichospermum sp. JUN01]